MGLDLTLIPERWPLGNYIRVFCKLPLDENTLLFKVIGSLNVNRFQPKFQLRESEFGEEDAIATSDPYGDPLTFLYASDFSALPADFNEDKELTDWNKAAFAFIRNLPPETRILLWWN